jgi:flavin reductase (DIM6/NTAB) family NADH-FMN oxidoreductase RutF
MEAKVKEALSRMSYGIYAITVEVNGGVTALTASWVSQVATEPPTVMIAVGGERFCNRILRDGKKFAINVLSQGQEKLAADLAGAGSDDRVGDVDLVEPQTTGAPILVDALAYLDCQVTQIIDVGDHTLFIGEVVSAGASGEGTPLSTANSNLRYSGD